MDTKDRQNFAAGIGLLCEAFRKEPTKAMLRAYWLALHDMSVDDFGRAVQVCLRECKFLPSPAEIRERCGVSHEITAAQQWDHVMARYRVTGGSEGDLDEVARKVLGLLGGYKRIGNRSSDENDTWTRKEFIRLYSELAGKPDPNAPDAFIEAVANRKGLPGA